MAGDSAERGGGAIVDATMMFETLRILAAARRRGRAGHGFR